MQKIAEYIENIVLYWTKGRPPPPPISDDPGTGYNLNDKMSLCWSVLTYYKVVSENDFSLPKWCFLAYP